MYIDPDEKKKLLSLAKECELTSSEREFVQLWENEGAYDKAVERIRDRISNKPEYTAFERSKRLRIATVAAISIMKSTIRELRAYASERKLSEVVEESASNSRSSERPRLPYADN